MVRSGQLRTSAAGRRGAWGWMESLPKPQLHTINEKMGDRPAWMRVKKYRAEGRNAELVLSLGPAKKRKDYWFPVTPTVYRRFDYAIHENSRSKGLKYLQSYIRRYRGYTGSWPDAKYVAENKNTSKRKSLITEAPIAWDIANSFKTGTSISDLVESTGLPKDLVIRVLRVQGVDLGY